MVYGSLTQLLGRDGIEAWVTQCWDMADYAIKKLAEAKISAWKNPYATTLIFPKPSPAFIKKWWLLTEGDQAHWVIKANTDKAWVDRFVSDLRADL